MGAREGFFNKTSINTNLGNNVITEAMKTEDGKLHLNLSLNLRPNRSLNQRQNLRPNLRPNLRSNVNQNLSLCLNWTLPQAFMQILQLSIMNMKLFKKDSKTRLTI